MHNLYMNQKPVNVLRKTLAEAIGLPRASKEPVYLTRCGRRIAAIVDADVYDALVERAEDAIDRAELRAVRDENDFVPWEEVKADLGML